jgi:hypothetical protein
MSAAVAVVHLVRAQNGTAPLERFLASYDRHPAGIGHDLVILLKGFSSGHVPPEYEAILARRAHERLFVPDTGYDISAYFAAARALGNEYLCFLNSFSAILGDDWLRKLHVHAVRPQVGIAAATGSGQSNYSDLFSTEYTLFKRPRYKELLVRAFPFLRLAGNRLKRPIYKLIFDAFPNYHVRTNGFLLRRGVMLALRCPRLRTKFDAYVFESGKKGLTGQILAMSLAPIVVGRDGKGYRMEEWHASNTFWQADQENLLIGDNQTDHYRLGSPQARKEYAIHAWGPRANPAAREAHAGAAA